MPLPDKIRTLLSILAALSAAVERRFAGDQPTHPAPTETDVDQALAHAGDVARRLRLDPAELLQQQPERPQAADQYPTE